MHHLQLKREYLATLLENSFTLYTNNWPKYRFGELAYGDEHKERNVRYMEMVLDNLDNHAQALALLEDEKSRDIYLELLQYRSLGPKHVLLQTYGEDYQRYVEGLETNPVGMKMLEKETVKTSRWILNLYEITDHGFKVICNPGFALSHLYFHQYYFLRKNVFIGPERNDVVMDCGACWGDTALLFASSVGPGGHVHGFEFAADNTPVFEANMRLNPGVIENVTLCRHPVSNSVGEELRYYLRGPSTRIGGDEGEYVATSITIDEYVSANKLDRVNFIKMDIEGSEKKALLGARKTIATFRPKLAISVYHRMEDLFDIPLTIKDMFPWYKLYLDHHSTYGEETVLYATTEDIPMNGE